MSSGVLHAATVKELQGRGKGQAPQPLMAVPSKIRPDPVRDVCLCSEILWACQDSSKTDAQIEEGTFRLDRAGLELMTLMMRIVVIICLLLQTVSSCDTIWLVDRTMQPSSAAPQNCCPTATERELREMKLAPELRASYLTRQYKE